MSTRIAHAESRNAILFAVDVETWDWSLRVFDHVDLHVSDYAAYLLDPDGNNVEALYRDEGNIGHGVGPGLR